jgi:hypothetical protein
LKPILSSDIELFMKSFDAIPLFDTRGSGVSGGGPSFSRVYFGSATLFGLDACCIDDPSKRSEDPTFQSTFNIILLDRGFISLDLDITVVVAHLYFFLELEIDRVCSIIG